MTASAETVLPEPLSPTRPNVFPRSHREVGILHDREPFWPRQELDPKSLDLAGGAGRRLPASVGVSTCALAVGAQPGQSTSRVAFSLPPPTRPLPVGRSRPSESRRPSATRLNAKDRQHDGDTGEDERPGCGIDELEALVEHAAPTRGGRLLADTEEAQPGLGQEGEAERQARSG